MSDAISARNCEHFFRARVVAEAAFWNAIAEGKDDRVAVAAMASSFLQSCSALFDCLGLDAAAFRRTCEAVSAAFFAYAIVADWSKPFVWPVAPYLPVAPTTKQQ